MTIEEAFPAYAGMFPTHRAAHSRDLGFPRVCGDVSILVFAGSFLAMLSPRMRGCFFRFGYLGGL